MGKYIIVFLIIFVSAFGGTYLGLCMQHKQMKEIKEGSKREKDETAFMTKTATAENSGCQNDTAGNETENAFDSEEISDNMKRQDKKYCRLKTITENANKDH